MVAFDQVEENLKHFSTIHLRSQIIYPTVITVLQQWKVRAKVQRQRQLAGSEYNSGIICKPLKQKKTEFSKGAWSVREAGKNH